MVKIFGKWDCVNEKGRQAAVPFQMEVYSPLFSYQDKNPRLIGSHINETVLVVLAI